MAGRYGHRNVDWNLNSNEFNWNYANLGVMMDIRDELKTLNQLLACPNFIGIPATLRRISKNTAKPRKKKRSTSDAGVSAKADKGNLSSKTDIDAGVAKP